MSQYAPLANFLESFDGTAWQAGFDEIEQILGRPLPNSAYRYNAWWANQSGKGHSQTAGWIDAGWKTAGLDLAAKTVRFEKQVAMSGSRSSVGEVRRTFHGETSSLWARAGAATGISNRDALIEAGLKALIARDAAFRLAELGGSMPDLIVPPRSRPDK